MYCIEWMKTLLLLLLLLLLLWLLLSFYYYYYYYFIIIIIIIKIEPPHVQTVSQLMSIVFNDSYLYLGVDDISCSVYPQTIQAVRRVVSY